MKCKHKESVKLVDVMGIRLVWCPECGAYRIDKSSGGHYTYGAADIGTHWDYTGYKTGKWKLPGSMK